MNVRRLANESFVARYRIDRMRRFVVHVVRQGFKRCADRWCAVDARMRYKLWEARLTACRALRSGERTRWT